MEDVLNPEACVQVRGLSKSFRGRQVLADVDLLVPTGSVAVVEGDNGSGKTTLIRILATVVAPDNGSATVNGYDVVSESLAVRRSIGVSFANERSLYWRITGLQNLELFGKIAGLPKSVIAERSTRLFETLHLSQVATGQVARMSTGQRQRLMIARALLNDPTLLLLDEPFRGLDDQGLQDLIGLVAERRSSGLTTLIVAPMIDAVVPVADATYRIESGTIVMTQAGHPPEPGGDRS